MKNFRNITLSILITATLLIAPASFADDRAPSLPSFDLTEFVSNLIDQVTSIFAPASPVIDTNGAPTPGPGTNQSDSDDGEDTPLPSASPVIDTNG